MRTFHVFYGWLDSDIPKDAEILDKIKSDAKATQDLAEAHRKIDAEAEEKRKALHAETEAKKSALGISSGPSDIDSKQVISHPVKPVVFAADPRQVVVPVQPLVTPLVIGKKGQ